MSYILDALRNSDQDRKKNAVPDLHSQPRGFIPPSHSGSKDSLGKFIVGGLVVILAGFAVWHVLLSPPPPAESESSSVSAPETTNEISGGVTPLPEPKSQPQQHYLELGTVLDELKDVKLEVESIEGAESAAPVATAELEDLPSPSVASPDIPDSEAIPAREDIPPSPVRDASPEKVELSPVVNRYEGIPQQRQLPYELQREIPELNISVHLFSAEPSSRLVRINNSTYREGDLVADQLKLEEITQDGVIMSIGDNRFWRQVR